jgi:hypothetical protein
MIDFLELRAELRRLGPADLLQMAFDQKEHHCVLNPNGSCQFYFKYKGFGFCVSELSGRGCQAEKPGLSVDVSIPYHGETITISRASSPQPLQLGQQVIIEAVEGLALGVSPATDRRR